MRELLFVILLLFPLSLWADDGVLPVDSQGKPLNLDFETGTLKDWTAVGGAFNDQPIKGDTVKLRRADMQSRHQGNFWIGGYEKHLDKPTGTLTSVSFKVTHPWATFLVGGGPHANTSVELVRADTKKIFYKVSGSEAEELGRVAVDLRPLKDVEMFIRIVDGHTGHWGHVNFDDFRFHQEQPKIPAKAKAPVLDVYPNAGLTPKEAVNAMTVPKDFAVTLFAGEPDVHQPIAMCTDDLGRLWVAEAYVYPKRLPFAGPILPADQKAKGDKILIFEDTNGDGQFDKRTTFLEGLNLVSGLEVGFGGVWIGAAPYFLYVPHDAKTDKAGEPQILLDGWGYQDTHETLNSFIWGHDGWLYGCHGVFTHSRVGQPGTPNDARTPINAGVWRYHPTKHVFEVFAHGTSNPWGLDWNPQGDAFVEACVIPHLWHIIQNARFQRQAGYHFNPYTYADIPTIAKHRHYVGATPHSGNGRSDEVGGGHAHSGLLCYQGGVWPKEYHGKLLMGNIHGHRINVDMLTPKGSGYEGDRNPDVLKTNDRHSLIVGLQASPDGNIYFIDWYDKQSCHRNEPEIWDRTNGRIYKLVHQSTKPRPITNFQELTNAELLTRIESDNEWEFRHARRILQERATDPKQAAAVQELLAKSDFTSTTERTQLRLLWLAHATGSTTLCSQAITDSKKPNVIAWAVRLLVDAKQATADILRRPGLADVSPIVRREIASQLFRLDVAVRTQVLPTLLAYAEDASDHNLPYLYWYVLESIAEHDANAALAISKGSKHPTLLSWTARRIATTAKADETAKLAATVESLASQQDPRAINVLEGMLEGFNGRRLLGTPANWGNTTATLAKWNDPKALALSKNIAVIFGDAAQLTQLRQSLTNSKIPLATRLKNLESLVNAQDKELPNVLRTLLDDTALRGPAIRALAMDDQPATATAIINKWKQLNAAEKRDALATLAARPSSAKLLLNAVEVKTITPSDVTADIIRAMRNLPDEALHAELNRVWGTVRESPAERQKAIRELKAQLTQPGLPKADLMLGRTLFAKTCQQCHVLYGTGGKVGPEITGSNRANLDYLLENILDPSAVIPRDYMPVIFRLENGRTITGIVKGENVNAVTVQTANELLTINKADIESRTPTTVSMMPEDQLKPFKPEEIRALFAYLQHPTQVPLLATTENAKDLFNGKDLTGWIGNPELWSVDNGEIVGKTKGLKKNEFLRSDLAAENFKLSFQVKLTPNSENSGVQFRSEPLPNGEMRGPQADIGAGWWGKLYEESGRGLLQAKGGEQFVKPGEWNDYTIEANNGTVKLTINGNVCPIHENDEKLSRRGVFGLQLHSGGAMEVRYKNLKLELLESKK